MTSLGPENFPHRYRPRQRRQTSQLRQNGQGGPQATLTKLLTFNDLKQPVAVLSVQREPLSARCTSIFEGMALAGEDLPLCQGGRAAFLVGLAINEVAFEIEVVVDVGVHRGELL